MKHDARGSFDSSSTHLKGEASGSRDSTSPQEKKRSTDPTISWETFEKNYRERFDDEDHVLDWAYLEARAEEIRTHERMLGSMRPLFETDTEVDAVEAVQHRADDTKDDLRACKQTETEQQTRLAEITRTVRSTRTKEADAMRHYVGDLTEADPTYPDALLAVYPFTESRKAWEAYEEGERQTWLHLKKATEAAEEAFNQAKQAYHQTLQPALDRWHTKKIEVRAAWKNLGKEAADRLRKTTMEMETRSESDVAFAHLREEQREHMNEDVAALFEAEKTFHRVEALPIDQELPDPPTDTLKDVMDIFKESLETQQGAALTDVIEKCLEALNEVYPLDALKTWARYERSEEDPRAKAYFGEKARLKKIVGEKYAFQQKVEERLFARKLHHRDVRKHPDYLAAEAEVEAAADVLNTHSANAPPITKEIAHLADESRYLLKPIEHALERLRLKPYERFLETAKTIQDRLGNAEERQKYAETYTEEVLDQQWRREGLDETVRAHKKDLWKRALASPDTLDREEYDQVSRQNGSPQLLLDRTIEALAFEAAFNDVYAIFQRAQKENLAAGVRFDLQKELPMEWRHATSYQNHGDNTNFHMFRMGGSWNEDPIYVAEALAKELCETGPRRTLLRKIDPALLLTIERHHDLAIVTDPEMATLFSRDAHLGFEEGETARAFFEGYGTEMKADPSFITEVETVAREMQHIQKEETKNALDAAGKRKLGRADLVILDELLKVKDEDLIGLYCYAMTSRDYGEGAPIDPAHDLTQLRHLRAQGLTCRKDYAPFLGSYHNPQYGIRELLGQPVETQERWVRVLAKPEAANMIKALSRSTDKIAQRPLYIEDLTARVEWAEGAIEVHEEGGQEALLAYACLNTATFAEAKATALLLAKENCLIPEGIQTLGTINWVRLLASADSPEMRRKVLEAFQRLQAEQPKEDGAFPLGIAAINAETLLTIDQAMQQEPKGVMEGLSALGEGMELRAFQGNENYREQQVIDRQIEGSRRQRVQLAIELLSTNQRGVFQVFCQLNRLAPEEARTIANTIAHDWKLEEAVPLADAVQHFEQGDEELKSLLLIPTEVRTIHLRTHAAAFARFSGSEQRIIRLGKQDAINKLDEAKLFDVLLDEKLPTRALTIFLDAENISVLQRLNPDERRMHLQRYEDLLDQLPGNIASIGSRIARSFAQKGDVAQERVMIERTIGLFKAVSPEAIDMLWNSLDSVSIEKLLVESDPERLATTVRILEKLISAPSASIQRIRLELAREIAAAPDPELVYEKVVDIFVRNNLPLVGKVFRVFEILHPPQQLEGKLVNANLSPTLRALGHRDRMMVFYKDLLRTHVASGNRELQTYFKTMSELDDLASYNSVEEVKALPEAEQRQWMNIMRKFSVLLQNSTFGSMHEEATRPITADAPLEILFERYQSLQKDLSLQPGQSVKERLEEMFLRPIGLSSIEEVEAFGKQKKQGADVRNRALVAASSEGVITIQAGDMLKGFDHNYFANILQNGSVAKEFLGSSADSDATPLDTDLSLVTPTDAAGGLAHAIDQSLAKGYGSVLLCVRPKDTFRLTTSEDEPEALRSQARARTPDQIEYFKTAVLSKERHMGIRTGFPLTEVDFIALQDGGKDQKTLRNLSMDIVVNGYYIPIVDRAGKVLFTPQEFDTYREQFCSGLLSLGQPPFEVHLAEPLADTLNAISTEIQENQRSLDEGQAHITEVVRSILKEFGALSPDQELLLEDTGSSGRGTGVPGAIDFDFVLKLDPIAMKKQMKIQETIAKRLGGSANGGNTDGQLRLVDVPFNNQKIEVDIAFVPQAEVRLFESHDAVRERLRSIKTTSGEGAYEQVQATIVYTKRLLKKAEVYKKAEQGGLGGIGVENWILAHHGNFIEAAQSFLAAAKPDGKTLTPLETFQQTYLLFDPGANAKFAGTHDHFGRNLSQKGYQTMVTTLEGELARLEPPGTMPA